MRIVLKWLLKEPSPKGLLSGLILLKERYDEQNHNNNNRKDKTKERGGCL